MQRSPTLVARLLRTIALSAMLAALAAPALLAQGGGGRPARRDTLGRDTLARDTASVRALGAVKVTGRIDDLLGVASSASEGRVGALDLRLRPLMREGELLETVPGMIVTQHSGDGKANQLFVRGFNLDHGTDFQTRIDGMPVNSPSHAHGQGYTDLNFLIPELVDYLDYRLGVHHASIGDFGSAGGAEFHIVRSLDRPFLTVEGGGFGFARLAGGASRSVGGGTLLVGGEGKAYDGPWAISQGLRKGSALARYTWGAPTSQFSVLAMTYRNSWDASDQVPLRSVREGVIGRFGQIDPSLGGNSSRHSLSGSWNRIGGRSSQLVQLFAIRSSLDLYSNFTYFLDDDARGDQFNQREQRTVLGANATHRQPMRAFGRDHQLTVGLQNRVDLVDDVGLYRTVARARVGTVREDDVIQSATGLFVEAESRWLPWLRTTLGVRGDAHAFDVNGNEPANAGKARDGILSPKGSIAFAPARDVELYVSGGLGFHSNDARGTTISIDPATGDEATRVDPLVRSRGMEFGLRATPARGVRSTLALWGLSLDSELLFVGDAGTTEPSDGSRRSGVTFANFYRPVPMLSLDADISFARARFMNVGSGDRFIPGALERVVAAGVVWGAPSSGPFAALRLRHFGSYPLIEDNSVRATATTLLNGDTGVQLRAVRLQVSALNLLNSRGRDIQYFYASRLAGEATGGIEDVHFHPVEPRQLRVSVRWEH